MQRDILEALGWHCEVHGKNFRRCVCHPFVDEQRVVFRRVAVVEAEDELAAVLADTLQRVRQAGGEVPQASLVHVLDVGAAVLIDGGDAARALGDEGPFGKYVPVQLANAAARQAHIYASDLFGDLEISLRDLTRPSAILNAARCVVERGPEHRQ